MASMEIAPTSGFNVKGADESSGDGSTEITAVPPDRSVGKLSVAGASCR